MSSDLEATAISHVFLDNIIIYMYIRRNIIHSNIHFNVSTLNETTSDLSLTNT